jgi:hypothetical protein
MRKKHIHITLALACVVASLAALGSLAGPVSSASAHTWHHRWSYLHFPAPSNFVQCVASRRIRLARGAYRWRAFVLHRAHPNDQGHTKLSTVRVGGGRYLWNDCLKPARYHGRYVYRLTSILHHLASGVRLYNDRLVQRGGWGDGRYHWGSTLDRAR